MKLYPNYRSTVSKGTNLMIEALSDVLKGPLGWILIIMISVLILASCQNQPQTADEAFFRYIKATNTTHLDSYKFEGVAINDTTDSSEVDTTYFKVSVKKDSLFRIEYNYSKNEKPFLIIDNGIQEIICNEYDTLFVIGENLKKVSWYANLFFERNSQRFKNKKFVKNEDHISVEISYPHHQTLLSVYDKSTGLKKTLLFMTSDDEHTWYLNYENYKDFNGVLVPTTISLFEEMKIPKGIFIIQKFEYQRLITN